MLDKMPGVLRDALGQMMNYVVIALRLVLDRQVCGLDAQVTVAEGERRVAVATGSQVSGKQHPAWGGVRCGQIAGPWEGGLEVECMGTGSGRAEAEKISADPGDRWLEENLERETEPEPETLNTLNVPSWLHRVVWEQCRGRISGWRELSLWLLPNPKQEGARKTECVGRKVMMLELPVWLGGAGAALARRGDGDSMLVPPKEQTV